MLSFSVIIYAQIFSRNTVIKRLRMAKSYKQINQDQRQFGSAYRKESPDTMNAFLALHKAAMVDGRWSGSNLWYSGSGSC